MLCCTCVEKEKFVAISSIEILSSGNYTQRFKDDTLCLHWDRIIGEINWEYLYVFPLKDTTSLCWVLHTVGTRSDSDSIPNYWFQF